jgi:ABC-2 type transport system ATP-binding protein
MAPLAQTRAVSMRFGTATVVDSVSLNVGEGEVVGLLGANGAGKTTLIRLLLGLLRPSSGGDSLFGSPPSIATRRRVGYVPQTLGLYADLTVKDNWSFAASAFGGGPTAMPQSIGAWSDELAGALPLGTQRRVAFALALSRQPKVFVLDEPTSGVGPLSRARLWQEIRETAEHGAGVLVTTHNMDEAEQCDRLVILADGQVVAAATVGQIVSDRKVIEVRSDDWQRAYSVLDGGALDVQVEGTLLRVAAPAATVGDLLACQGVHATTTEVPANLEEAFMAIVSRPAAL